MTDLAKTYDPTAIESRWYQEWLNCGYFHAEFVCGDFMKIFTVQN